jgi:hypothetical protein
MDWQRVRALFERLLEAAPEEREALLAAEPDAAVAAEVRELLAHESAGTNALLALAPASPAPTAAASASAPGASSSGWAPAAWARSGAPSAPTARTPASRR